MTTDMTSLMSRLEATASGQTFLSLEDLASETRFKRIPIDGFNNLEPGMWYEWAGERRLMVLHSGDVSQDTLTVEEVIYHKRNCFVFDGKIEGQSFLELVKSYEHIRDYRANSDQFKVMSRKVDHASEILENAIFLHSGVFYQRDSSVFATRCDNRQKVRLSSLDATVFDVMRCESRSDTMVVGLNTIGSSQVANRSRQWQYGATWALLGAVIAGGSAVLGVKYWHTDAPVSTEPVVVSIDVAETLVDCKKRDAAKDLVIAGLRTSVDEFEGKSRDCNTLLSRSESSLSGVTSEFSIINAESLVCRDNYIDCDTQLRAMYIEHGVSQVEISQLSSHLTRLRNEYSVLLNAKHTCDTDLQTARSIVAANQPNRESDVIAQNAQCQDDLIAVRKSLEQCDLKRSGNTDLRGEVASLRAVIFAKDALLGLRQKAIDGYNTQLGASQGIVIATRSERDKYKNKLDVMNGNIITLNGTVASLRDDLSTCGSARDLIRTDLGVVRGDYDLIARDLVISKIDYEQCVAHVADLQSQATLIASRVVPLTPGSAASLGLGLSGEDALLQNCYTARDSVIRERDSIRVERDVAMSAHARYDFMKEKLKGHPSEENIAAVDSLLGRWIAQTCGSQDPRCTMGAKGELAFQAFGNTFRESSGVLYRAFVGDLKWRDGAQDSTLLHKFVELVASRSKPNSNWNIDTVAPFNYKFYSF